MPQIDFWNAVIVASVVGIVTNAVWGLLLQERIRNLLGRYSTSRRRANEQYQRKIETEAKQLLTKPELLHEYRTLLLQYEIRIAAALIVGTMSLYEMMHRAPGESIILPVFFILSSGYLSMSNTDKRSHAELLLIEYHKQREIQQRAVTQSSEQKT